MCKICPRRGPLWTNASYCRVETQWDNVNKDLYWLRPFYSILTLIPSAFLLHFLFRLRKRIQVYCVQSLFTTLSVVCSEYLFTSLCPHRWNDLHHCVLLRICHVHMGRSLLSSKLSLQWLLLDAAGHHDNLDGDLCRYHKPCQHRRLILV